MQTVIIGNLTKEPEMKYFDSGKYVTNFSLAVNGYSNGQKNVSYFNCQLWNKDFVGEYCKKGDKLVVQGVLKKETYKSKTGEEKSKLVVVANRVGYDMGFVSISGKVEKLETRTSEKGYKTDIFKLVDNDAIIYSNLKDLALFPDLWVNVFGAISINTGKVEINALKIDFDSLEV